MKFIPAHLLGKSLRNGVRNPLFHQGDIPDMNMDEKYDLYTEYLDLLVRITLRILKYDGKYITPVGNYSVKNVWFYSINTNGQ